MASFEANTPQLKAVKRLIDAYVSLDLNNLEPVLAKDYRYEALPEVPGVPIQTKETHLQMWKEIYSVVSKLDMAYNEVIEAPGGKVVVHATRMYSTVFGGSYHYDTIAIVDVIEEDGEFKVVRCKDFADPQKRGAHVADSAKAVAERAAA